MTGVPGSGKSALLCNLVSRLKQDSTYALVYHFIGFAEGSAGKDSCINFLIFQNRYAIPLDYFVPNFTGETRMHASISDSFKNFWMSL